MVSFSIPGDIIIPPPNIGFGENPHAVYFAPSFRTTIDTIGQKLMSTEAITVFGKTLDTAFYWGFTPYLFRRKGTVFFASLNDTQNKFCLPLNKNFVIIMTRNIKVMELLASEYSNQGYHILPLALPEYVRISDDIFLLGRAIFINKSDRNLFIETKGNLQAMLYSLKADYKGFEIGVDLIQKPKAIRINEYSIINEFFVDYNNLILNNITIYYFTYLTNYLHGINLGIDAISTNQQARADNRDCTYKIATNLKINNGQYILLNCVNHVKTNKGIYMSIDLYNEDEEKYIASYMINDQETLFYTILFVPKNMIDTLKTPAIEQIKIISIDLPSCPLAIAERTYVQLPENIAPESSTIISPIVYIIQN
jgi:hypothetical protein